VRIALVLHPVFIELFLLKHFMLTLGTPWSP
jgi:hypothetical protein